MKRRRKDGWIGIQMVGGPQDGEESLHRHSAPPAVLTFPDVAASGGEIVHVYVLTHSSEGERYAYQGTRPRMAR